MADGALTDEQLAALVLRAGFPRSALATMVAIAHPESNAIPTAVQQGQPYASTGWGLWQITPGNSEPGIATDKGLLNPGKNAEAALAKYKEAGFKAWTTWSDQAYQPFMPAAQAAVLTVTGDSKAQIDKILKSIGAGGETGGGGSGGSGPVTPAKSLWSYITDPLGTAGNVAGVFSDLLKALAWITNPFNWARIIAGFAGLFFAGLGLYALAKAV